MKKKKKTNQKQKLSMFKRNFKMNYSPQDPPLPELTRPFPAPRPFHGKLRHSALLAGCLGRGHFSIGNHWQIHILPLLFDYFVLPRDPVMTSLSGFYFLCGEMERGFVTPPSYEDWKIIHFPKYFCLRSIISAYSIDINVEYVTLELYPRLRPCLFLKISVIDMIVGLRERSLPDCPCHHA